jgi:hypothetical protein
VKVGSDHRADRCLHAASDVTASLLARYGVHGVLQPLAQAQRWEWIWINPAARLPATHVPNEIHPQARPRRAKIAKATVRSRAWHLPSALRQLARGAVASALRWSDVILLASNQLHAGAGGGTQRPALAPTKTRRAYQVSLDSDSVVVLADHPAG